MDTLYTDYLAVIGKLKDIYKLHVDADHRDIHTFYVDKRPVFKLLFGVFSKDSAHSIVVSFHMDVWHAEAVLWFINLYNLHKNIKVHDSYMEDSNGETYLGEDALAIKEVYQAQQILSNWLETHDAEEIKDFTKSKVVGRERRIKIFDSKIQKVEAEIEFDRIKTPEDEEDVH